MRDLRESRERPEVTQESRGGVDRRRHQSGPAPQDRRRPERRRRTKAEARERLVRRSRVAERPFG
ncbi:hypothetical protein AB0L71_11295 [Streptomyces sp. NPDC052052]|uniref:hypothetical protein n=1 Tax=Streptomyces sp. NPDC052052 TaxID=3154756 RepID=UPI00343E3ACE